MNLKLFSKNYAVRSAKARTALVLNTKNATNFSSSRQPLQPSSRTRNTFDSFPKQLMSNNKSIELKISFF